MRRQLCIITAALFPLILASANIRTLTFFANPAGNIRPEDAQLSDQVSPSHGENIKIFFHGLMVGRYNQNKGRFEVGILKGASGHDFRVQIWDGPGLIKYINVMPDEVYEFDVLDESGSSLRSVLQPYKPQGANFDRLDRDKAKTYLTSQDYRYIPDIEGKGLHEHKKNRRHNPFDYTFHVLKGVLKSKCLTDDIITKKKEGDPEYDNYGYIAEIVGVEVTLLPGQELVLRRKGQPPLWRCLFSDGKTVEARALYLPADRTNKGDGDYITEACKSYEGGPSTGDSHFQMYYVIAIDVPPNERFRMQSGGQGRGALLGQYGVKTIYPYKCGMVLQSQTKDDIDEDDMD